jgi:drug/metabolite transporter (DMT)-like permease
MKTNRKAIAFAILAAALFAINSPFSKLLLEKIPPTLMAALLYLGAGCGLLVVGYAQRAIGKGTTEQHLSRKELPYLVAMVILDIAALIFLMVGLKMSSAANAALLYNFEIVATSIVALFIFKEAISRRLWIAIFLVTLASIILSFKDIKSFSFSLGSIFVLMACICWGIENNCTRVISMKNPLEIAVIKGLGSGFGALFISILLRERATDITYIIAALVLGFFAYGLSVFFYVRAQRDLGAAKTSTFNAITPFIGVTLSWIIFLETPTYTFIIALMIMLVGAYYASFEAKKITESSIKVLSPDIISPD